MKKFLLNFLLFTTLIAIVNIFFFRIVYLNYFQKYEDVDLNYTTYLLADSHGPPLDKTNDQYKFYNFSIASDSYVDIKRKVQYLIENSKIERIILTTDEHTLSKYRDKSNNLDRSLYFANSSDFENFYNFINTKFIKRYVPLFNSKSRDIIKIYFKSKKSYSQKNTNNVSWNSLEYENQLSKSKNRVLSQFPTKQKSGLQLKALVDIIALCKKNNIEIIGIKYPISKAYNEALSKTTYNIDSIFAANNLKLYDFSKQYTHKDFYFSDQDHLNQIGGKKFSQIIYTLLK